MNDEKLIAICLLDLFFFLRAQENREKSHSTVKWSPKFNQIYSDMDGNT